MTAAVEPNVRRFNPYPEYKDSGVEWLGEIPKGWVVERSDSFLRYEKLQIDPSAISDELVFHYSIPSVQAIGDGALESPSEIDSSKLRIVGERLLVSRLNPRKGVVLVASEKDVPTLCSTEFVPLQVRRYDLRWAMYLFIAESTRQRLSAVVRSATRSHQRAEVSEITKIWHAVPPEPEQRAIAAFLDRETARIDALVAKKERLIELLQEKRTALITRAVTRGLDPNVPMKDSGVEWLGEIPVSWEVKKATWLFSIGSGTTPRSEVFAYYGGDTPWVTTSELRESEVTATEKTVTEEALRDHPSLRVYPRGSVAVAMYGATIGRLGVLGLPAAVNQACCVFSNGRGIDARFWFYWMQMRRPYLVSLGYGGGQPNLSQELLRSLRVPTPSVPEQRTIVDFLDRETAKLDALVAKVREAIERLKEFRTALISAAVTGKIDVRGEIAA